VSTLLICLPHAGSGPGIFRPWNSLGIPGVEVHPITLPGRERRLFEEPYLDVAAAVEGIAGELAPTLPTGRPVALFGHCLGALLCFELARRLRDLDGVPVAGLFVSGSAGPEARRDRRASDVGDDDEFLRAVEEVAGYRDPAMDDPELRELMLPTLRADVRMHEDYRPAGSGPIDVPITALRGDGDAIVSAGEIAQWRAVTTAGFDAVELPGGHLYFVDQGRAVLEVVAQRTGGQGRATPRAG
jgi:surfactin synthase thioesterase subunit